jgi:hypothetical protein
VRRRTFPVSFFDTALAAGTTYTYRVRAVGSAGASAYSNRAQGTTVVFSSPAAPSQLTAARTGDWITLRWRDNSTNELQFTIERCDGGTGGYSGYSNVATASTAGP